VAAAGTGKSPIAEYRRYTPGQQWRFPFPKEASLPLREAPLHIPELYVMKSVNSQPHQLTFNAFVDSLSIAKNVGINWELDGFTGRWRTDLSCQF